MGNSFTNSTNTENAKQEIEGIKEDIESLVQRLANIKDNSGGIISEQLESLSSVISDVKDRAVNSSKDNLAGLYVSTRRHPLRNLAYALGTGFLLAYIVNR